MNFKDANPIYLQIAERISEEILAGKFSSNERIPSVREYSALLEVNINTAVKAYDYLSNQGVIYNKRGMGYFVSPDAIEHIRESNRKQFMDEILPEVFRQMKLLGIDFNQIQTEWNKLR